MGLIALKLIAACIGSVLLGIVLYKLHTWAFAAWFNDQRDNERAL